MQELIVISEAGFDNTISPATARLWHTQTSRTGLLVARTIADPHSISRPANRQLHTGYYIHRETNQLYFLRRQVLWLAQQPGEADQLGVWYSAQFDPELLRGTIDYGRGPDWFRPLTTPDGRGWLDRQAGGKYLFQRRPPGS